MRVRRPGVRLAYRRNYRDKPTLEQTADRTLTALVHGFEDNPLDVSVEILPAEPLPSGRFHVTARLQVPLYKLVTIIQNDVHAGRLRIMVIAGEPGRESSGLRQVQVPVLVPHAQMLTAFGQKFAWELGLELTAGDHAVAFAVRDELAATTSFLRRMVRVEAPAPAPGASAPKRGSA